MISDYKDRAYKQSKKPRNWKTYGLLLLALCLLIFFISFSGKDANTTEASTNVEKVLKNNPENEAEKEKKYTFYFLLTEEKVIPAHEIKVRSRERYLGKEKNSHYMIQAGAFKKLSDANKLKAQLESFGLAAQIKKRAYGNVIWNKVQLGPYSISQVNRIKTKLSHHRVDSIVLEVLVKG